MYDKILIGYDESEYSMAAVREVAAWVNRHGGAACIIHGVYFDEEEFGIKPSLFRERMEKGEGTCYRGQVIAADLGIPMAAEVREGDPPDVIVDAAAANNTDLIALGTYGRKGLGRMILGSVTAKVIAEAPCDVLVIRRACDECAGKYKKILVAYDGSPAGNRALEKACSLARSDGAAVTALYVIPQYQEMINFFKTEGINRILVEEGGKILARAREIGSTAGIAVEIQLDEGNPAQRVVHAARQNKSDLVVMGSYGWNGINKSIIGSTAERVIMMAENPVLVAR